VTRSAPEPARFQLPGDAATFVAAVLGRCHSLIHSGIWGDFDPARLERWFNLFRNDLDQYFAACLLDVLVFRSRPQTEALMLNVFQRAIPDQLRLYEPALGPASDWWERLQSNADPHVRVVPVLRVDDPPTKSAPVLARLYRQRLHVNERWMIWPWKIKDATQDGVSAFLFIDDFLGSGTQFIRFFKHFHLDALPDDAYLLYAPLAAHRRGIQNIRGAINSVHVVSSEVLGDEHSVFESASPCFRDDVNTPAAARAYYRMFLRQHHFDLDVRYREGFGRLALTYAFAHATPNNCLPLLWYESDSWAPLFER
jgi:hypothetical protein